MTTFEQHLVLYGSLRSTVLARHLALGRHFRTNLISMNNLLAPAPTTVPIEDEPSTVAQWAVASHERENPLLYGALLQTALAVEHHFGSLDAEHILRRNLQSVGSLVSTIGADAGWVTRWDPVTTDNWATTPDGLPARCNDFLVDDAGAYPRCAPMADPRHVAWRGVNLRRELHAPKDAEAILSADGAGGSHWQYVDRHRSWEPSMDEFSGLFGGWSIADALVPGLRPLIRPTALAVAGRLAAHGYTVIRPGRGFGARGSTGLLSAFELPFDRWVRRIGGTGARSAVDFEGALELAGYMPALQTSLNVHRVEVALLGPLLAGALSAILPLLGPIGETMGGLLGLIGTRLGPETVALALTVNDAADLFDPYLSRYRSEPVLAAVLSALSPGERFHVYCQLLGLGMGGSATNFPPYLALMSYGDTDPVVVAEYITLIRARRQKAPKALANNGLDCAFATAVAVIFGAHDLAPTLAAQLEERWASLSANGGGVRSVPSEPAEGEAGEIGNEFLLVLDYLGALALAWLYDASSPGHRVLTRAPTLADMAQLPVPVVPAAVLKYLPDVRRIVLGPDQPAPDHAVPLFSGIADRAKDIAPTAVLPPVPTALAFEFTYELGRWTGDLPTGVYLKDGDDYEISVTGNVDGVGPEGGDAVGDAAYPLHVAIDPRAREGAVVGMLDDYFLVGSGVPRRRYLAWHGRDVQLILRINRTDRQPRATEAFHVTVRVWGPTRYVEPTGRYVSCVDHVSKKKRAVCTLGGVDPMGRHWRISAARATTLIADYGQVFRVFGPRGARVTVVHGKRGPYLRSVNDGTERNNLRSLDECVKAF